MFRALDAAHLLGEGDEEEIPVANADDAGTPALT